MDELATDSEPQQLAVATKHGNEIYTVYDLDDADESIEKLVNVIAIRSKQ